MSLSQEQLDIRKTGITATDMTKICGLSNYGGPIDVLLDKRGTPAPFVETDRVRWGNILEGPIREDYAQRHGVRVIGGDQIGTLAHPTLEWLMATPDGLVTPAGFDLPQWGWEGKTHTGWLSHLYGDPGTDQVPAWELVQCQTNLIVARAKFGNHFTRWDLTAFMDGVPQDYVITHDQELADMLIETARAFWFDHVIGGKPLDPDGSDSFSEHLARKFPTSGNEMVEADHETLGIVHGLHLLRNQIHELEGEEARHVQHLKEAIAENAGLEWSENEPDKDGNPKDVTRRITWKRSKDSTKTDWLAAYDSALAVIQQYVDGPVGAPGAIDHWEMLERAKAAAAANTTPKPGSRRFVVPRSWSK